MYLAKVAVGSYTTGDSSMKEAPLRGGLNPHALYDSVVNDMQDPIMYIVFRDVAAYPAYHIAFTQ